MRCPVCGSQVILDVETLQYVCPSCGTVLDETFFDPTLCRTFRGSGTLPEVREHVENKVVEKLVKKYGYSIGTLVNKFVDDVLEILYQLCKKNFSRNVVRQRVEQLVRAVLRQGGSLSLSRRFAIAYIVAREVGCIDHEVLTKLKERFRVRKLSEHLSKTLLYVSKMKMCTEFREIRNYVLERVQREVLNLLKSSDDRYVYLLVANLVLDVVRSLRLHVGKRVETIYAVVYECVRRLVFRELDPVHKVCKVSRTIVKYVHKVLKHVVVKEYRVEKVT